VGELRKAILQLAVQGKLVPQDPNDELAAVLLERIKGEKARLVKGGKIRKQRPLLSIENNNIPFKLPQSWAWVSLGEIVDYNGAQKVSPNDIPDDAWLLDLENIEKDTSRIVQRIIFKNKKSKSTKSKFENGDVLYGKLRPYLNKVVVADGAGYCTTEIIPLRGYYGIFPKYLMYALKRPDFLEYVNSKTYGVKMPPHGALRRTGSPAAEGAGSPPAPQQRRA
jgi:type I restriction enzyme S subunit